MATYIKERWVLLLVLAVFIVLKWAHLYYPFFWDESWPYASGVYHMYHNGPSLMPGAISGELARGHPLMFHFLAAVWMKVFGTSHFALHLFPLTVSILFLIAIYEVALRLFDHKAAIAALLLVAFQQTFFVQSAMVLTEIFVACTGFLSMYFYVARKYLPTAICLTLLYYTKESGLIVGFVLGIDAIVTLFRKNVTARHKLLNIVSLAMPVLLIGIFFLLQKKINGWYVLPLYSEGVEQTWPAFYDKFRGSAKIFFRDELRRYFFLFLALLSVGAAMRSRSLKPSWIFVLIPFAGLLASDKYHWLIPDYLLLPLFGASLILAALKIADMWGKNNRRRHFLILLACFIVCFCVYSALNMFFIERYLLIALIPILFIAAVAMSYYAGRIHKYFFIPALVIMLAIETVAYTRDKAIADNKLSAFDGMYVHKKVVEYMEQHKYYNRVIGCDAYLERIHLTDPHSGYLSTADTFVNVNYTIDAFTEVAIFDNIEPDIKREWVVNDTSYILAYKVEKGLAWAEIYIRKSIAK